MAGGTRALHSILLAGAVCVLGYVNWVLLDLEIDTRPVPVEVAGAETAVAPADSVSSQTGLLPLASLPETVSRPLFHPTRRPFQPPREPEVAEAPPPPSEETAVVAPSGLSLVGLMGAGTSGPRALIRAEGQPQGTWVEVGGEIAGWTVSAIEDDAAHIEKAGTTETLVLHARKPD